MMLELMLRMCGEDNFITVVVAKKRSTRFVDSLSP
jgi:hypothetical protein